MSQEQLTELNQPKWKWYLALCLVFFGKEIIKEYSFDSHVAFAISSFIAAHIYYFVPPRVKMAYLKYWLVMIAVMIWYLLLIYLLANYLLQYMPEILAKGIAYILLFLPLIGWFTKVIRKENRSLKTT